MQSVHYDDTSRIKRRQILKLHTDITAQIETLLQETNGWRTRAFHRTPDGSIIIEYAHDEYELIKPDGTLVRDKLI